MALKNDIIGLKRQHEDDVERVREKDRQIQQLKSMLVRNAHNNTPHGERDWPSGSRLIPASIGIPKVPASNSIGVGYSKSAGFQNYVRKKEKGEMAQERDLMNLTRKKNPIA